MKTFYVAVDGEPVSKGRARGAVRTKKDGNPYVHMYVDEKTADAERTIWAEFKNAYPGEDPLDEPFILTVSFFEGARSREKQQDVDNLSKTVLDALNGHAWVDDRDCVTLLATVVRDAGWPHTEISIRTLSPSEETTGRRQLPLEAAS